jgi:hypothetical protein
MDMQEYLTEDCGNLAVLCPSVHLTGINGMRLSPFELYKQTRKEKRGFSMMQEKGKKERRRTKKVAEP